MDNTSKDISLAYYVCDSVPVMLKSGGRSFKEVISSAHHGIELCSRSMKESISFSYSRVKELLRYLASDPSPGEELDLKE